MTFEVKLYSDPAEAVLASGEFLGREPVINNLILTLLQARALRPEPGRYWITFQGSAVAGVALQTPLDYPINLSDMRPEAAAALADVIASSDLAAPGVVGEARLAAQFAGQWSERQPAVIHPYEGQRIYEARELLAGAFTTGKARKAADEDRPVIREWMAAFLAETGSASEPVGPMVDRRVDAGEIWIWQDGAICAMAAHTRPVANVSRVQYVYTPMPSRRQGYAEALVRALTGELLARNLTPMLFTDLANPTSNSIYRRIGYTAIRELVRYRFEDAARGSPGASAEPM